MASNEYKILSLTGGGVRGVFQACFLARLEKDLGTPLRDHFDMVAATSTGGIVGLGLAAGLSARTLRDFYLKHSHEIFRPRRLAWARRGYRYDVAPLRTLLDDQFEGKRLGDLPIEIAICASNVNRFEGKVFTRDDGEFTLVDVALAAAAAPTYFPPVVVRPQQAGFMDGGLWANDPSVVAISHAIHRLGESPKRIKLLAIGTGTIGLGYPVEDVKALRLLSLETARFLIEFTFGLQAWYSRMLSDRLLTDSQVKRITPLLRRWITLDDPDRSLATLPALADAEYAEHGDDLKRWLCEPLVSRDLTYEDVPAGIDALLRDAVAFAPDSLVGINRGGAIVGGFLAKRLQLPYVEALHVNCDRDPAVVRAPLEPLGERVLLVDDACRKGEHMRAAYDYLRAQPGVTTVRRAVMLHNRTTHLGPEQQAFRGDIDVAAFVSDDAYVRLPWDPTP